MVTKKSVKSLKLNRETLRHMTIEELRLAAGGILTSDSSCGVTATSAHCCYTL